MAPGETQRKPALIIGGWDPDQEAALTKEAATDILRSVEAPIPTDGMFVPGVRRGYAILPIDDRMGESFEQRRQRIQEVIAKVRGANYTLANDPMAHPAEYGSPCHSRRTDGAGHAWPRRSRDSSSPRGGGGGYRRASDGVQHRHGLGAQRQDLLRHGPAPRGDGRGRAWMGGHRGDRHSYQVHQRSDRCPLVPA